MRRMFPLAALAYLRDAQYMAKKREAIDDLIDAYVWMRRKAKIERGKSIQIAALVGTAPGTRASRKVSFWPTPS
jgi:hypothetical protein